MKPRRYQLRKEAVGAAMHHPWIFRGHMSSAASVLRDGELLRLVDGGNRTIGYGLYEATGAIAIRMLRRGPAPPDAAWLRDRLVAAIARRAELATRTDALRLVHGESDSLPGVVVDRFGDTLVVTSYAAGADVLARYVAHVLARGLARRIDPRVTGPARHILLRPARLRHAAVTLRAGSPPDASRPGPATPATLEETARSGRGAAALDHDPDHAPQQAADLAPDQVVDHASDLTPDPASDLAGDQAADLAPDQAADLMPEQASDLTPNQAADHAADLAPDQAADLTPDQAADRAADLTPDQAADHAADPPTGPARVLRGAPPAIAQITEDGIAFAIDLAGQKTGAYLDLRGLRREVAAAPLAGARVLNLFAYSGMLGRAAERAGAAAIVQVDASERALAFAAAHHVDDPARHTFVTADVFAWLPSLTGEPFDLVILDPPAMTSRATQVPSVLAAYRKLVRAAARHVRPGGALVVACCTSRIERAVFRQTVRDALDHTLGPRFVLDHEIPPEPDHPVGFPQSDYLKIGWWKLAP
ncbi:MAG TPA: class I SAM-dependent methyltransferase [Kofleriaceae bacterium]